MLERRKLPKTDAVIRIDAIVEACRGKRVLNIGMGGWVDDAGKGDLVLTQDALKDGVHYRVSRVAAELTGTDILQDSCDKMARLVPGSYVQADLTSGGFASHFDQEFDVVVFAEVLEHLDDFRSALANIRSVLAPRGQMVLTTANAYSADRIAKMFLNYEAVHEEHTAYFSYLTMLRLLEINGWNMERFDFHIERPARNCKRSRKVLFHAMRGLTRLMPQFGEGIFVIARPAGPAI